MLTLMNIFWYSESYPGTPGHIRPLEKGVSTSLDRMASNAPELICSSQS